MLDPFATSVMLLYQCLVCAIFAALYSFIGFTAHFSFPESKEPVTSITTMYFTLTAQTTTGFGDIHPKTDLARLLVAIHLLCAWTPMLIVFA